MVYQNNTFKFFFIFRYYYLPTCLEKKKNSHLYFLNTGGQRSLQIIFHNRFYNNNIIVIIDTIPSYDLRTIELLKRTYFLPYACKYYCFLVIIYLYLPIVIISHCSKLYAVRIIFDFSFYIYHRCRNITVDETQVLFYIHDLLFFFQRNI